jgi:uncharacterized protein (TIGR03435 family)
MRYICCMVVLAVSLASAQSPGRPSFEVASFRRNTVPDTDSRFGPRPGGRWSMENSSIATLIHAAYPTQLRELVGAPGWVTSDRYDLDAKAAGEPSREELSLMLQMLLAERLKLSLHTEQRERPVFALTRARSDGPPGLVASKVDCDAVNAARRAGRRPEGPMPANGAPPCAWSVSAGDAVVLRFGGLPLSRLSDAVGLPDGRVVIDRTGLTGPYEFTLRYSTDPAPADIPSLFVALEEQLGLKLVPDRASLPVLVIDHIERPTPN